jgi:hypothetical protein
MSVLTVPFLRTRAPRRDRRAEQRRLERLDSTSARLAELHAMGPLLDRAADVVAAGWVQAAWFTVASGGGRRSVTTYELRRAQNREVVGACLVGAIVHAGGGPASVRSQLVRRTLDLTWHALHGSPEEPVRWCPGPDVRMLRVLDLTSWNDAPGRTQGEVVGLLVAARRLAEVERSRYAEEHAQREHELAVGRADVGLPAD